MSWFYSLFYALSVCGEVVSGFALQLKVTSLCPGVDQIAGHSGFIPVQRFLNEMLLFFFFVCFSINMKMNLFVVENVCPKLYLLR